MNWNIRELKRRGAELANANRDRTRSLVLLYCGVIAALSLGSSGLNLYLDSQISGTGGLDGLGLRSVLQTIQELLTYGNLIFDIFWSAGFLAAMIAMVRGGTPDRSHMTAGFRQIGRILGYIAFQFVMGVVLMITAVNLGTTLYAMTPMGEEYRAVIGPILSDPNVFTPAGVINWDLLPMDLFLRYTMPIVAVCMALFAALYIFISYRFRLAVYLIMTQPVGAVRAHFLSARLMRGHKWKMLRLDLSWWWYYLLLGAASVVNYLDMILDLMGVPVPLDPVVMFFATLICYCVLFSAICLWKKCRVDASYVLAYEAIANPEPVEEAV